MRGELAIHHLGAGMALGQNPFGRDVANLALFRAFARHGGFERLHLLTPFRIDEAAALEALAGGAPLATQVEYGSLLDQGRMARAGVLFRGKADLPDLAWARRGAQRDAHYSLVGLIHTLAPPLTRQEIALSSVAPVEPWDAIVCTSPAVQGAMQTLFAEWTDYLGEKFGGPHRPAPMLPMIPLGVDLAEMTALADRPQVRAQARARLGLTDEDVLVLWVGRLSFFEKAAPQPMFRAVEEAGRKVGRPLHFALAGWFPNPEHRPHFEEAAQGYAPTTPVHWIDGNDRTSLGEMWAAADIFISLVDNIQETFGLAPVEAMAAGLPVVASDWDGYRFTIQHGRQGFLASSLIPAPGPPSVNLLRRHQLRVDSYQAYAGQVAHYTAINVREAAEGLAALAAAPDLRRRLGQGGRQRVREVFDWPQVMARYRELFDELAVLRGRAGPPAPGPRRNPVSGDPFRDFAGFATRVLAPETRFALREGIAPGDEVALARTVRLDGFAEAWRAPPATLRRLAEGLAATPWRSLGEILVEVPPAERPGVTYGLVWLCKMGVLDWL